MGMVERICGWNPRRKGIDVLTSGRPLGLLKNPSRTILIQSRGTFVVAVSSYKVFRLFSEANEKKIDVFDAVQFLRSVQNQNKFLCAWRVQLCFYRVAFVVRFFLCMRRSSCFLQESL